MENAAAAHGPINVAVSDAFVSTNKASTEIPIVLAYNGQHFESLIPTSNEDIQRTVELAKAYKTGRYDIPSSLQDTFSVKIMLAQEKQDQETNFKTKVEKRNQKDESLGHFLCIYRVGKCQIFYTDQYQQTRFTPRKARNSRHFWHFKPTKQNLWGFV